MKPFSVTDILQNIAIYKAYRRRHCDDVYRAFVLKPIFGNHRNYQRFTRLAEIAKLKMYLASLGWRPMEGNLCR